MSLRVRALTLSTAAATLALAAGLFASIGGGVNAQVPATATAAVQAGGPQAVPLARFFGTVTSAGTPVISGAAIIATIGTTTCGNAAISAAGQYQIDIQALPGCTPGGTVSFTVNGARADQTGTVPAVSAAVQLNLTVTAATPTPVPATVAPPPPPPPPPPATASPTPRPTVAPTAIIPARPPVTGLGGTSQQKPLAPVAQRPAAPVAQRPVVTGAVAAAPAARPALPNTGTGGLFSEHSDQPMLGWLALGLLLTALGAGSAGLLARRR
jgi:hypothetical protein